MLYIRFPFSFSWCHPNFAWPSITPSRAQALMPLTQVFVTSYFYSCNTLQQIPWLWSVLSLKYFQTDKRLHSETHAGLPTIPSIFPVSGRGCTYTAKGSHKVCLPSDFEDWEPFGAGRVLPACFSNSHSRHPSNPATFALTCLCIAEWLFREE